MRAMFYVVYAVRARIYARYGLRGLYSKRAEKNARAYWCALFICLWACARNIYNVKYKMFYGRARERKIYKIKYKVFYGHAREREKKNYKVKYKVFYGRARMRA